MALIDWNHTIKLSILFAVALMFGSYCFADPAEGSCRGSGPQAALRDISSVYTSMSHMAYQISNQGERQDLVEDIIANCSTKKLNTTPLIINGRSCEVSNDNVSVLFDGTYVPLTFPEAQKVAQAYGFRLPTEAELVAIGRYAMSEGNQFPAITRSPNNSESLQLQSMNEMMNDPRMKERARAGQDRLIDGHFKWYTSDGRIYGFAKGDGTFFHNRASGAHTGNRDYYDYSHGVRLIRCQ